MSESRLPSRFPVGTKFIIEAKFSGQSRIYRRHVVFPDGRVLRLPDRSARRTGTAARQRRLRP
jgi:hypothetical protein